MSVTPKDFLDSAIQIGAACESEISTRNAMSRAYYAAYHRAHEVFPPDDSLEDRNTGLHKRYIDRLMQADANSPERKAGVQLNSMRGRRTKADYGLAEDIKPYLAAMQISQAKELFELLDRDEENAKVESGSISHQPAPETTPKCQPKEACRPVLRRIT